MGLHPSEHGQPRFRQADAHCLLSLPPPPPPMMKVHPRLVHKLRAAPRLGLRSEHGRLLPCRCLTSRMPKFRPFAVRSPKTILTIGAGVSIRFHLVRLRVSRVRGLRPAALWQRWRRLSLPHHLYHHKMLCSLRLLLKEAWFSSSPCMLALGYCG